MEDTVQIRCARCKNVFRDRARRLRNGYSRQCPSCEIVLFFDNDSPNPNIKRAMQTARSIRKALRENENKFATNAAGTSRSFSGRSGSKTRQNAESDDE
ncbi:hypothetical protein JQ615_38895 [Bradyrhizobium jicamae]|uniref:Uncharacterized protein n=1 Tax=Bradyrhizobium jicamae TaxID=280332 RepID=A0ABS5FX13_9BRAD|nr:hypothetical protein [Bradyrhizobium jicamae]MBR0801332.1 hypothetical protein [Bradyrhizobium jicamae]MBR0937055.1 hypothetical protein [Bradyrhizobium jicamae]